MQALPTEMAKATAGTAVARSQDHQARVYLDRGSLSTPNLLEQAADVLCLLSLFPLSMTAQTSFFTLLERRLQRALGRCR